MSDEVFGDNEFPTPAIHPVGGASLTKQADAEFADINKIVARHLAAGVPIVPPGGMRYGDFTTYGDYHECMNRIVQAQEQLEALPLAVRDLVKNDPGILVEMLGTDEGVEALKSAGLKDAFLPVDLEEITPVISDAVPSGDGANS